MPRHECFLCRNRLKFGPQTYLGMQVKVWGISVCKDCYASQRGGIVPALHPHLVEHLTAKAITPDYDDHGWIRWPLEKHASP